MPTQSSSIEDQAREFSQAVSEHFDRLESEIDWDREGVTFSILDAPDFFWKQTPQELQNQAEVIVVNLIELGSRVALACKQSALSSEADIKDLSVLVKKIRAALHLHSFDYHETEVIHNEGTVIGVQPARQEEWQSLTPDSALSVISSCVSGILRIAQLADESRVGPIVIHEVGRLRPDTAFIMMRIDPSDPGLVDVNEAVKETFGKFDIQAVRADEIEHEDLITQRVLDEIKTSEFLFANMTDNRPNVYYEVGYAHALGKKVILYRKAGTGLHFDLAGYNCPEYEGITDLKDKLTKRLVEVTNRKPKT